MTVEDVLSSSIEDIIQRPVDPCHIQYLTAMGVQSSLGVPIFHEQKLWGLLISHHTEPKDFSQLELEIVQTIADQVSVAIAQSNLFSQARSKARQEALINQITTWLHAPMNMEEIMCGVLEKVIAAISTSGGRIYINSTDSTSPTALYTYGIGPSTAPEHMPILLENYPFWQQLITGKDTYNFEPVEQQELSLSTLENSQYSTPHSPFPIPCSQLQIISDIYQEPQLLPVCEAFRSTRIRGMMVMPLKYRQHCLGCLTIFRDEIDTNITWAGHFDPDHRNLAVRNSFEAWREFKRGQIRPWTNEEIEIVQSVGNHLAMALMQNLLYQWEREQRILVEMRNQELNIARTIAEEASRLKSDFLSSTSHELRTPLTSTLNYLKLLKEGFYDSPEELKEYIQVAHQSAENLVEILNDILDIAKIESGHMTVNLEPLNLPSLLEEKRKIFNLESRYKEIEFTVECEVDTVWADEIKLGQILTNLLSNSFKFTSNGKVGVKAIRREDGAGDVAKDWVVISVSDTGIGIELSRQNRLFEAFVQADGSIKRRYGGTGLGLAISKRLVELMGGEIWMDSAGKGQGTTVTFTLPGNKAYARG